MERRARITLIVSLFVAFLVVAPLLLLYTSGYRYNTAKHRIEKTGSISIESVPRGAEVRVDGTILKGTTPLDVSRLLPETYTVEVLAKGYVPWKKRLTVESGRTTFAKNIALLPDTLPRLDVAADAVASAWRTGGGAAALAMRNDGWLEIAVTAFDGRERTTTVLDRFPADAYADVLLAWMPDGRTVTATLRTPDGDVALYLYDAQDERAPLAVHDRLQNIAFARPTWGDGAVVVLAAGGAYTVDHDRRELAPFIVASGLTDVAIAENAVWTLRKGADGTVLERRTGDGAEVETVARLGRPYRFVTVAGNAIVLSDAQRGTGLVVDASTGSTKAVTAYTDAVAPSDGGSTLLLCGGFELAEYDPAKDAEPRVITRISEPITSCAWHPSGQYAFYATADRIVAIDLDDRDRRDTHEIADFDAVSSIATDADAGTLRFVGKIGAQKGLFERPL